MVLGGAAATAFASEFVGSVTDSAIDPSLQRLPILTITIFLGNGSERLTICGDEEKLPTKQIIVAYDESGCVTILVQCCNDQQYV